MSASTSENRSFPPRCYFIRYGMAKVKPFPIKTLTEAFKIKMKERGNIEKTAVFPPIQKFNT
jgi:hypothetical protein